MDPTRGSMYARDHKMNGSQQSLDPIRGPDMIRGPELHRDPMLGSQYSMDSRLEPPQDTFRRSQPNLERSRGSPSSLSRAEQTSNKAGEQITLVEI